jgi:hypothetical protein
MGKSCVRFTSIDALPLEVIGEAIRRVPGRRVPRAVRERARQREARKAGHEGEAEREGEAEEAGGDKQGCRQEAAAPKALGSPAATRSGLILEGNRGNFRRGQRSSREQSSSGGGARPFQVCQDTGAEPG